MLNHPQSCLYYDTRTNFAGSTALNAIPPIQEPADRIECHLAMLQRLAEIGMQLAERAAADALQEPAAAPPKYRRPDPTLLFIRLSAMVRACITQQARLAAGKIPTAPRARSPAATPPDAIDEPPKPIVDRTEIRRAVEPIISEYLEIDPDLRHPGGQAIIEACQAFGIPQTAKVNTGGHSPC